jgi:hypothetical protein
MTIATITLNASLACFAMKEVNASILKLLVKDALKTKPVEGKECVFLRLHYQHMGYARKFYLNQRIV